MGKYQDAALALRREAERARALIAAADMLDEVGALDQIVAEMVIVRDSLNGELDVLHAEVERVKLQATQASEDEIRCAEERSMKADAERIASEASAKNIIDEAQAKADQIVAIGRSQADQSIANAASRVAELADEKAVLEVRISEAKRTLQAKDDATKEVEERLVKAQEQIAKLLGK